MSKQRFRLVGEQLVAPENDVLSWLPYGEQNSRATATTPGTLAVDRPWAPRNTLTADLH